jgi:hypothetical protein
MKYLKRFNESVDKSNIEEIKQTIREILLPISDMGYEIGDFSTIFMSRNRVRSVTNDVDFNGELTGIIIRVVSYTDTPLKMNDEVTDEFIRMKEYLESSGFNSVESIYVREGSNYRFEEDFNEFIILEEVILRNLIFVAKVN